MDSEGPGKRREDHVDPRYTRTSSAADVYARIRPGTDAAFQNTMIHHIIVNKLYDEEYVVTGLRSISTSSLTIVD